MKLSEQIDPKFEDKVYRLKTVISELSKYQDLLFNELVGDLGIRDPKIQDYLFDFLFNEEERLGFAEYLDERGH